MKRTITACICALMLGGTAVAQNYQIPNSDFEVWNNDNEPGNGWYSFVSAGGDKAGYGKPLSIGNTTKVEGRTGYAVQIASKDLWIAKANGNLTTGRINMGSTKPQDVTNYNFTDRNAASTNNCPFVGLPDSVSCWAKFTRGGSGDYPAQGNFVLHGDIDYKDPHESDENVKAYRVAGGTIKITPCTEWTYFKASMDYTGVEAEKMYMLGSFTTNPTPGGSANDKLQIDDVKFIYNSRLESITIADVPLDGFNKDTYIYKINELPAVSDIIAVSDGKGAQVDIQEGSSIIKIFVTGNDGAKNQHIYSLVKEGTTFSATSIQLNEVELAGFDPTVYTYENLEMKNGSYPVVSVASDPAITSVDIQLDDAEHVITVVVTDKLNNKDYTYLLKFTPSEKIINGSQIKGDFEVQTQWGPEGTGDSQRWGTVADGWFSSNVTQLGSMNFVMVEEESHVVGDDKLAVKMVNGRPGLGAIASNAPGYIALGSPWVYADMMGLMTSIGTGGVPDADDSDGGTIGGINFSYRPDSIVGYYKRTYADSEGGLVGMNPNEDAKIIAYLWKGISTSMAPATGVAFSSTGSSWQLLIDRDIDILGTKNGGEPAEGVTLVASAQQTINELADWTRISVPLNYVSDEKPEKANVIISSADYFNRASIGNGNTLSADNVAFIYNSKLESLTINDTPLEGFDKNTYMYVIKGELPSEDAIVAVADGKGAKVNIEASDDVVKIIVTGNDGASNQHIYSLIKEGATFSATSIKLNDVDLDNFDPATYSYEGLEMVNGVYPTVAVSSDRTLTSVDMQLNEKENTITIVVTDNLNEADHTYTLKFTPSDKVMNGSQIKGDFEKQEQWGPEGSGESARYGTVAEGWSSSNVTQMGFLNFVMVEQESHVVGDDKLAVKMINGRPGFGTMASNAPGYITLGTPWVYADVVGLLATAMPDFYTPDTDDSDGGTIGGVNFSYQPDSIVGYYKRTYADAASELVGMNPNEDAKIIAYLWKGISASMASATDSEITGSSWQLLIDRDIDILGTKNGGEPVEGVTLVASAQQTVKELTDWTRISVPLNYVSDEKPEKANVIISSADYFNRANIGNGNTLSADNVAFVYNSKLESITVDGTALVDFDKDTYTYDVDGDLSTATDIIAVSDGKGATIEITAVGKVVTITVKGNDIADNAENFHTYTLTFKAGGVGVEQNTANTVSVKSTSNSVIVEGVQQGELVEVYSVQGMLVGQYTANGTLTVDGLSSKTIYLVKIGSYVTRVLTK
ncbi:hypothetical protein [Bacteroides sp.]